MTNAKPDLVTFSAARHHRPFAGTKLYCLVTEGHVCVNNLPGVAQDSGVDGIRTRVCHPTATTASNIRA